MRDIIVIQTIPLLASYYFIGKRLPLIVTGIATRSTDT